MLSEAVMADEPLGCRATSWLESYSAIFMSSASCLLSPDCLRVTCCQVHLREDKLLHVTWFSLCDMPCKITFCNHASNSFDDGSECFFEFQLFDVCAPLGPAGRGQIVTWTLSSVVSSVWCEFSMQHRVNLASRAVCMLIHGVTFCYATMPRCLFVGAASLRHVISSADAFLGHR